MVRLNRRNLLLGAAAAGAALGAPASARGRRRKERDRVLKVSKNRRFLVDQDGRPFFWLADTAWELFHRLNREEADLYLRNRAERGFTVIQAVVLAELGGLVDPNPYGHLPLQDNDPTRPVEAYFRHVDWIVRRAAELGLRTGMLPTWGDKWNKKWGMGPEIFTPENARQYGRFLGARYREQPIVWILGGDRPIESDAHRAIIRAMAAGLEEGDGGRHLMTFHPNGGHTSAEWWHEEPWLDFNMLQSGHDYNRDNYRRIAADYARTPVKPCLDGEPGYEAHPAAFKKENGYMGEYDVRKFAYWALFSGAHGHTYGCHDVWQMWQPGRQPITHARTPWREAIELPGAAQMGHARRLLESRPFLTRVPDPGLLLSDPGEGTDHVVATRDTAGTYALVYIPSGKPVRVRTGFCRGSEIAAAWFDPRTGESRAAGRMPRREEAEFTPPSSGPGQDWVLILDDAAAGYRAPARG